MVFTTAALEIEIHFVTSQTIALALSALKVEAAVVASATAAAEVACGAGVGIETTTKRRLFIAQWVLPLKLFVHHNRFRWIH